MKRAYAGIALVLISCKPAPEPSSKLQVTASFYPLYFFAQQIGGDRAEVVNITPAGAEPHDYEPTAKDMARIERGGLLILSGGGVEPWGEKMRRNIDSRRTRVVEAIEGLARQQIVVRGQRITDPHVWLSPPLAERIVDRIEAGFAEADPPNAAYYASNAQALKSKLEDLDAQYKRGLARCARRDIITSHAAFGYLATTYGLNQVPVAGLAPEAEPSPQELAEVARFAKEHDAKVIFFEKLVSPKLSQTIANEVGARTMVLDPIEGLSGDDIAAGKNYLTEMQQNLATLEAALQCTP